MHLDSVLISLSSTSRPYFDDNLFLICLSIHIVTYLLKEPFFYYYATQIDLRKYGSQRHTTSSGTTLNIVSPFPLFFSIALVNTHTRTVRSNPIY